MLGPCLSCLPSSDLAAPYLVLPQVAVYEQTRDVARDAESLRLALASSRDACSRMEADMARARAEATRAAATLVEKDKEMQAAMESYQARVSRLSSELEQVLTRVWSRQRLGSAGLCAMYGHRVYRGVSRFDQSWRCLHGRASSVYARMLGSVRAAAQLTSKGVTSCVRSGAGALRARAGAGWCRNGRAAAAHSALPHRLTPLSLHPRP